MLGAYLDHESCSDAVPTSRCPGVFWDEPFKLFGYPDILAGSQIQHYFLKLRFRPERLRPLQLMEDAGEGATSSFPSLFGFG